MSIGRFSTAPGSSLSGHRTRPIGIHPETAPKRDTARKTKNAINRCGLWRCESGWRDLNTRPLAPQAVVCELEHIEAKDVTSPGIPACVPACSGESKVALPRDLRTALVLLDELPLTPEEKAEAFRFLLASLKTEGGHDMNR